MNSRFRSPLLLLQEKQTWPDPELSIGTFCGVAKGKFSYWEARGPAEEAYDQVRSSIREILNSDCGPVRCSSAIVYDIYMVGRTAAAAVPHIMFSCKQAKSRKQAVAAVRKSRILKQFPGIELGHWECPPHIVNLRLLASSALATEFSSTYHLRSVFDEREPSKTLALQILRCESTNTTAPQSIATVGSVVKHDGRTFYVAPHHVFAEQNIIDASPADIDSEDDNSECEFGAFPDTEDITDEEVEFMSQYSASPPSSALDIDLNSETEDGEGLDEDFLLPESVYSSNMVSDRCTAKPEPAPPVRTTGLGAIEQSFHKPTTACRDLDYALVEVLDNGLAEGIPVLSPDTVAKVRPWTTKVTAVTGSGRTLRGLLTGRASDIRLPSADTFEEAFAVRFDDPLLPGDCGSIVHNAATGKIYGHIFLGSVESRVAYIMPAIKILAHLGEFAGRQTESTMTLNPLPTVASGLSLETNDTSETARALVSNLDDATVQPFADLESELRSPSANPTQLARVAFVVPLLEDIRIFEPMLHEVHHAAPDYTMGSIGKDTIVLATIPNNKQGNAADEEEAVALLRARFPNLTSAVIMGEELEPVPSGCQIVRSISEGYSAVDSMLDKTPEPRSIRVLRKIRKIHDMLNLQLAMQSDTDSQPNVCSTCRTPGEDESFKDQASDDGGDPRNLFASIIESVIELDSTRLSELESGNDSTNTTLTEDTFLCRHCGRPVGFRFIGFLLRRFYPLTWVLSNQPSPPRPTPHLAGSHPIRIHSYDYPNRDGEPEADGSS